MLGEQRVGGSQGGVAVAAVAGVEAEIAGVVAYSQLKYNKASRSDVAQVNLNLN